MADKVFWETGRIPEGWNRMMVRQSLWRLGDMEHGGRVAEAYAKGKFLNRRSVRQWVVETPVVRDWLERSLDWLPTEWRAKTP